MNNLGTAFLYGNGSGNDLNFQVKTYASEDALLAATPSENTFGIVTTKIIPGWSFSAMQPGLAYKDVNILNGIGTVPGYLSSSGTISSQSSTNKEVTVDSYLPVEYGMTYNWTYNLSASKSMWFAISEYTGSEASYKHKTRTTPVNAVTGTSKKGTYTPSASNVTAIKVSWRTFGDSACAVTFVEKDVPYSTGIADGYVWVKVGGSSIKSFNSLKKNELEVYPTGIKQYSGDSWSNCTNYLYQNSSWGRLLNGELFDNGLQYEEITGGWTIDNSYYGQGSINTVIVGGSWGNNADQGSRIYTNKAISKEDFNTFKFIVIDASGNNTFYLKFGSISGTNVAYYTFNGNKGTFSIAIPSGLTSFYPYLQTGGTGRCTITKIWME